MEVSKPIAEFADFIRDTRAKLADVNAKIEAAEQERQAILTAKPHSEDIVAFLRRSLDGGVADFNRQFASFLSATFVSSDDAAEAVKKQPASLLRLEPRQLSTEELRTRTMKGGIADLNAAVLTYFLRDKIAEEIPALVNRLCPDAQRGMKSADRASALSRLDELLESLRSEHAALQADLTAARGAIFP